MCKGGRAAFLAVGSGVRALRWPHHGLGPSPSLHFTAYICFRPGSFPKFSLHRTLTLVMTLSSALGMLQGWDPRGGAPTSPEPADLWSHEDSASLSRVTMTHLSLLPVRGGMTKQYCRAEPSGHRPGPLQTKQPSLSPQILHLTWEQPDDTPTPMCRMSRFPTMVRPSWGQQ